MAYNFGCKALYNLLWRASISSHQIQGNIPTFEALMLENMYLFLEQCRKSNNVWSQVAELGGGMGLDPTYFSGGDLTPPILNFA